MERQQKKQTFQHDPRALYQDHFVSVRPDCLVIKQYFIPSMLPFEIPWDQLESLVYNPQIQEDKTKVRDKGMDEEGRWWATDVLRAHERELRLYNVRIEADCEPRKSGFTVIHIDQFLKACRPLIPYSCHLSGCVWSE
ncbi:unnamed protein product [Caenorhabditis sp. 36 PRJEB53466]|nr:unnamed protein product [Caenorhabditis sp. 36 PRJEB53466]